MHALNAQGKHERDDFERQQFFAKLQGFQKANDAKAQNYSNFITGQGMEALAAEADARYVRDIALKEDRDRKKDEAQELYRNQAKQDNLSALRN